MEKKDRPSKKSKSSTSSNGFSSPSCCDDDVAVAVDSFVVFKNFCENTSKGSVKSAVVYDTKADGYMNSVLDMLTAYNTTHFILLFEDRAK